MESKVDTPFSDEDVNSIYEFTQQFNIQLTALRIESVELSGESIRLMSLIAPSIEKEEENEPSRE